MILAAAQIRPNEGKTKRNISDHCKMVKKAALHGASLILFPEMSLTGYTRQDAGKLAFSPEDPRLGRLRNLASKHSIIIIAGAPVAIESEIYIGAFILDPSGSVQIYTKQYLHSGEEQYFEASFERNPSISPEGEQIAFSICADIENPAHPESAAARGCTLYLTGIFYSPESMDHVHSMLSRYARKYSLKILMANFCGPCWGQLASEKSGYWDQEGNLIHSLNGEQPGLLLAEVNTR